MKKKKITKFDRKEIEFAVDLFLNHHDLGGVAEEDLVSEIMRNALYPAVRNLVPSYFERWLYDPRNKKTVDGLCEGILRSVISTDWFLGDECEKELNKIMTDFMVCRLRRAVRGS